MPKVPVYEEQIQNRALPGAQSSAQVSAEDFGFNIGRVGQSLALKIQQEADDVALMSSTAKLKERSNRALYDPEQGYLNKKGKDAFEIADDAVSDYDKMAAEFEGELATTRQRQAFRRVALNMRNDYDLLIQRHVAKERQEYDATEFQAFIKSSQDRAILNYTDPMMIAAETEGIRAATAAFAARNGKGKEWADRFTFDQMSATHVGVIERMLANQQELKAKEYFGAVKNAITGPDAIKVEKAVESGVLRAQSQSVADNIMLNTPDEGEIYAKVREIKDPQLRDAVQARVDADLNRRDRATNEMRESYMMAFTTRIDQGQSIDQMMGTVQWWNLTTGQRTALKAYAKQKSKGGEPETDWETFYNLTTLASTQTTRNKFLQENLLSYRHKLSDAEFRHLTELQRSMRSGQETTDQKALLQGYRTTDRIVDDSLRTAGIDPTPKQGSSDAERVAKFRRLVDEYIIGYKIKNKTPLPPSDIEIQQYVDQLLVKGKVRGSGIVWDDTKFAFEADPEKAFVVSVKDIPPKEVTKIKEALRRMGSPITDAEVVATYNLKLRSVGVNAPAPPAPKRDIGQIPTAATPPARLTSEPLPGEIKQ
jgi:hypothetical protein